jgi:acetyl-CoA carboxylase carboxyltransferase component
VRSQFQAKGVMQTIEAKSAKSRGSAIDEAAVQQRVQKLKDKVVRDGDCYKTSSYLHDDGVIDPRDTRDVLGMCLEVVNTPKIKGAEAHNGLARL